MLVRTFDGTCNDARGIIEVDQATFGDCHYTPEYVVALEADPGQYAWVAEQEGRILGFASAFATHGLTASHWEIDLVAVHPSMQGRGVGTALVARAFEQGRKASDLSQARALVATKNIASQCVFAKNGFSPGARVDLLLYEIAGRVPRPPRAEVCSVRTSNIDDAPEIAALSGQAVSRVAELLQHAGITYLVSERSGELNGYVELVHVRTLQYEGFWVESLHTAQPDGSTASALLSAAIEEGKRHMTMDEIGYLVPPEQHRFYRVAVGEGFKKVNEYLVFTQELDT